MFMWWLSSHTTITVINRWLFGGFHFVCSLIIYGYMIRMQWNALTLSGFIITFFFCPYFVSLVTL